MRPSSKVLNVLLGSTAALVAGAHFLPDRQRTGPVLDATVAFVGGEVNLAPLPSARSASAIASVTNAAVTALSGAVRPLSRPEALGNAFHSYFAYKAAHPDEVRKPYLYFVDYGQPSTAPRGYVFDMESLRIVDGPFTVAHGRGSSSGRTGIPTRFSNRSGSAATSLGLYVTEALYSFHGHSGGRSYSSIGLRLKGVSSGFNDNALARGVVAHGAPYVTPSGSGRSEGCPAMEEQRAERLLPRIADGAMVFLFAPDENWMTRDPWLTRSASDGV